MAKYISANWGMKILSLFIALILWFHIITERQHEETLAIPISYINLREGLLLVKPPPDIVKVRIKGRGKELMRLRFGEGIKLELNFSEAQPGWNKMELKREDVRLPYWSNIELIGDPIPERFIIMIDKKVKKWAQIVPNLPTGYEFELIPERIQISGASGSILSISMLRTEEITPGAELPETLRVKLKLPEEVKTEVDSVTIILRAKE